MGRRCRKAAWGATFALIVAACAATETPSSSRPDAAPARPSSSTPESVPTAVTFPDSLADASFVQAAMPDGPCVAGDNSQVSLFSAATGTETWSFPIPRPGSASVVEDSVLYVSFRWDRDQHPGIGAIDLTTQAPLWQRFLPAEPESMTMSDSGLIVVTSDDVRAIDINTGDDLWVNRSEFDFSNVVLAHEAAYAIDSVGVHAIDYATGKELWELPIERPDALAADGSTLAVAAGNHLIAVDVQKQTRLLDMVVSRVGAGEIWVTPKSVAYELAPSVAPGGGVAVLDRNGGGELWRATSIGDPLWAGNDQLISSTANDEALPAQRFVLFALDGLSGEELWRTPSTAQAFNSVVGTADGRLVVVDPHPVVTGMQRVRLLNSATGEMIWETASNGSFDGAVVDAGSVVTMFGSRNDLGVDRGSVAMLSGNDREWIAGRRDGISQEPVLTPHGLLVISGERSPTCVGRNVGEPSGQTSAVLGASIESDG